MTRRCVVLDVVGLTPRLLAHMPRLRAVADARLPGQLGTVLPAVTCSVQSTFLTGAPPAEHGIVGNGWYFRDLGEVLLWRQHNALVGGEKLWEAARRAEPGYTVANVCWWYAMGADVDWTVTPAPDLPRRRPQGPGLLHRPAGAARRAHRRARRPSRCSTTGARRAGIASSPVDLPGGRADPGRPRPRPDPGLRAAPRLRPAALRPVGAAGRRGGRASWTRCSAPLLDAAAARGATVVALSEYGITDVSPPGRRQPAAARARACCEVYTQDGHGVPRPVDVAGVRRRRPPGRPRLRARPGRRAGGARSSAPACPGWPRCSTPRARRRTGWTTRAPANWSLVAEPDAWFTYYYWLDDARAPGLRPAGRDPPQARLRPGGAVLRPGRPGRGEAPGRGGAGPQEARHALPDERGRPGRRGAGGPRLARPAAGRPGGRPGAALLRPVRGPGLASPPPRSRRCCWSWPAWCRPPRRPG